MHCQRVHMSIPAETGQEKNTSRSLTNKSTSQYSLKRVQTLRETHGTGGQYKVEEDRTSVKYKLVNIFTIIQAIKQDFLHI